MKISGSGLMPSEPRLYPAVSTSPGDIAAMFEDWRGIIKFPDLSQIDWDKVASDFHNQNYDPNKVTIAMANTAGIFLVPIDMMGWVDGMCAMLEEPEEYQAPVDAPTDRLDSPRPPANTEGWLGS